MKKDNNLLKKDVIFKNFISLGRACGTAGSLQKNGYRSFSGPFDWYGTENFKSVLNVIETDFVDFMKKENLRLDEHDSKVFIDEKYGFRYNHDVKQDFETEYDGIYKKYMRRVEKFKEEIQYPTCFVRAVSSKEEIDYIECHHFYINEVIKKGNKNNIIVFLLLDNMPILHQEICYRLYISKYIGEFHETRAMFDKAKELLEFCDKHYDKQKKIENKIFDRRSMTPERIAQEVMWLQDKNDNALDGAIRALCRYKKFYIWGAGKYGTLLTEYFAEHNLKVEGIIDSNEEKQGLFVKDIEVFNFETVQSDADIFISIPSEKGIQEIKECIEISGKNYNILLFEDVFEYLELE